MKGILTADKKNVKHHTRLLPNISGPYLLVFKDSLGTWTPSPHGIMSEEHLYHMKVHSLVIDQEPEEVCVVNPDSGEWETVWTDDLDEGLEGTERNLSDKVCPTCGIVVEDVIRDGKLIGFYCPECSIFYTNSDNDVTHSASANLEERTPRVKEEYRGMDGSEIIDKIRKQNTIGD